MQWTEIISEISVNLNFLEHTYRKVTKTRASQIVENVVYEDIFKQQNPFSKN